MDSSQRVLLVASRFQVLGMCLAGLVADTGWGTQGTVPTCLLLPSPTSESRGSTHQGPAGSSDGSPPQ